jgi:hypothetical protein
MAAMQVLSIGLMLVSVGNVQNGEGKERRPAVYTSRLERMSMSSGQFSTFITITEALAAEIKQHPRQTSALDDSDDAEPGETVVSLMKYIGADNSLSKIIVDKGATVEDYSLQFVYVYLAKAASSLGTVGQSSNTGPVAAAKSDPDRVEAAFAAIQRLQNAKAKGQ